MNDLGREGLDAYYKEASTWNHDRIQAARSARKLAWWVAGVAAAIALLEAIALVVLMPLKTVQPYTLMVDRTTGYVQALNPVDPAKLAPDRALTQAFLAQYVTAREGFDLATLNTDYRKVALLSADSARTTYLQTMQVSNPQSPLALYPRTSIVEVQVKSVSPIGANAALVRFDTIRSDAGSQSGVPSPWAAVIRYRYSGAPMKLEDRLVNPLGFQVTGYRKDPEVAPAQAAPPSTAVPAGQVTPVVGSYYQAPAQNQAASTVQR